MANITEEIQLLSRIKDVLDELNIMAMLFADQRKVLKAMNGALNFIYEVEEEQLVSHTITTSSQSDEENEWPAQLPGSLQVNEPVVVHINQSDSGSSAIAKGSLRRRSNRRASWSCNYPGDSEDGQSDDDRAEEMDKAAGRPDVAKRSIWMSRNDPDNFSLPLAKVNAGIDEIASMIDRAEKANQAVSCSQFALGKDLGSSANHGAPVWAVCS